MDINEAGTIVVFRQFQSVAKDIAHTLLDIFANNSRLHTLFGEKLLTLVQVDKPDYQLNLLDVAKYYGTVRNGKILREAYKRTHVSVDTEALPTTRVLPIVGLDVGAIGCISLVTFGSG